MDYTGEKLAESTSEGSRIVWGVGSRSSLRVERVLYHLTEEHGFAVHAILRSGGDHHPVLARVELFPRWSGVAYAHPDLARAVSADVRAHHVLHHPEARIDDRERHRHAPTARS